MKTTVELPDDLLRRVKIRAVEENKKLKDMLAELLRRGLDSHADSGRAPLRRVQVPIVHCAHEADPSRELTPERVAALLLDEDGHDLTA